MPYTMLVVIFSHPSFSPKMEFTLNKLKAKYFPTYHNQNQSVYLPHPGTVDEINVKRHHVIVTLSICFLRI